MSDITSPVQPVFPAARGPRIAVVALLSAQVAVLVGFAVAWLVSLARGTAAYPEAVVGLAVFAVVAALLLVLCARGVWRAAAWTRAPVITFQLLLGVMGIEWIRGDAVALGVLAVVVAVVVIVALLRPGVVPPRRPFAED